MKRAIATALALWAIGAASGVCAQQVDSLDVPEQEAMTDTLQYALEYNASRQASEWVNPDTGRAGGVAPVKTFEDAQGRPCREFITTILIGGREEQGYGTACRQPDGTWEIVAEDRLASQGAPPAPPREIYVYTPPREYYRYPQGFYGPYPIFLSYSHVYRRGHLHHGSYYLAGRDFRRRHPVVIRERVFVGPRVYERYRWREVWKHRERFEHRGPGHRWDGGDRRHRGDRWEGDGRRGRGGRWEGRWSNPDRSWWDRNRGRR
jgi:surface antigen